MAKNSRKLAAIVCRERKSNQIKRRIARRINGSGSKISPQLRAGYDALHQWRQHDDETTLSRLEHSGPAPSNLLSDSPWWCQILTTEPSFLNGEERQGCEMLMGLSNTSALPDWNSIGKRAVVLFDAKAKAARKSATLHMYSSLVEHSEAEDCAPQRPPSLCGGRVVRFTPAYGYGNGLSWMSKGDAFDRRREKRRTRTKTPESWTIHYHGMAQALWKAGLSSKSRNEKQFDDWCNTAECLAQSMIEHGAQLAIRCQGFFRQHGGALDDDELMEAIDAKQLDILRATWALESQILSSTPKNAKTL